MRRAPLARSTSIEYGRPAFEVNLRLRLPRLSAPAVAPPAPPRMWAFCAPVPAPPRRRVPRAPRAPRAMPRPSACVFALHAHGREESSTLRRLLARFIFLSLYRLSACLAPDPERLRPSGRGAFGFLPPAAWPAAARASFDVAVILLSAASALVTSPLEAAAEGRFESRRAK